MPRARLAVLAIFVAATAVNAAPQVEIKAKSALTLTKVKSRDDGVEVTGQLVDKLTNEGLSGQNVTVTIEGQTETAMTQTDGTFRVVMTPPSGAVKIQLGYTGTRSLDRADPLTVTTDPSKQQIELNITKVTDDLSGARLRVAANSEDGPADNLPIALAIAPQMTDAFHELPGAISNSDVELSRKAAGGPGMYRLRAIYKGDDHAQAASKEVLIELASATITTTRLSSTKLAYEDDLVARGTVMDDDNRPVPNATVTLTSGDRRLAQGATADDGTYRFSVEASVLGQGQIALQVQADPGPYVKPSRSDPQIVKVSAPAPVPVSYTIAAFLATGLAAAAFFVARKKPWLRLRRAAPPAEAGDADNSMIDVGGDGGLVVAKPGIVSTLRRAQDDGFAGIVRDTIRGRPIAEAVIRLVVGDAEREVRSAVDGTFAIESLATGEWQAEVAAPGHVTERFNVTIPHRGELRGVRIDLVPVRERVFQLYRRAAEPVLPEPRLWGIWTPRQIVDHVRTKRPTPALADLTDFVEEVYFSPRLAAESQLALASERVDKAIQERASRR